ncbi:MAG: lysophospholipid acyltransferase family protein [Gemmatimonadota bacterium]
MKLSRLPGLAKWGPPAGALLLEALLSTVRVEIRPSPGMTRLDEAEEPYVVVFWHGRLLPLAYAYRGSGVATLISRSRDGRAIAEVASRWGYRIERGSSSRGGSMGLRGVVRHLEAGRRVALTPDGPRGPARVMKLGPLLAARLTGAPIVPIGIAANRAWHVGSWDRFMLPQPFARVLIQFGEPLRVPADASDAQVESLRERLEGALNELVDRTDADVRG